MIKKYFMKPAVGIFIFILIIWIYMSITIPIFLTTGNILNIFLSAAILGIVSFGMTFILLIGGIDFSVGSIMGISGALVGYLMVLQNVNPLIAILGALGVGLLIGFINGLLISKLGYPDLLVTLAMMMGVRSFVYLIGGVRGFEKSSKYIFIGQGKIFGIPIIFLIGMGIFVISLFILKFTVFGRKLFAIGDNREASRVVGIDVNTNRVITYIISGFLAGLAGVLLVARLGTTFVTLGDGYELQAITAVIIGGTSLYGGRASLFGTLMGIWLIASIQNVLILQEIDTFWFKVVLGFFILIAVTIDSLLKKINT